MPKEDIEQRLAKIDELIEECKEIAQAEGLAFRVATEASPSNVYVSPKHAELVGKLREEDDESDEDDEEEDEDDAYEKLVAEPGEAFYYGDDSYGNYEGWQSSWC